MEWMDEREHDTMLTATTEMKHNKYNNEDSPQSAHKRTKTQFHNSHMQK